MDVGIEIRPLVVEDIFTVARMLTKVAKNVRMDLAIALTKLDMKQKEAQSTDTKAGAKAGTKSDVKAGVDTQAGVDADVDGKSVISADLGMAMFQSLIAEAEDNLKLWLADLIGKTSDEFKLMPIVTMIDLIEGLFKQKDAADFFVRVSQLASRM